MRTNKFGKTGTHTIMTLTKTSKLSGAEIWKMEFHCVQSGRGLTASVGLLD